VPIIGHGRDASQNPAAGSNPQASRMDQIEGAYRFFNDDSVKPDRIIASHIEATYQRIDSLDFVLCVQDSDRSGFMNRAKDEPGTQTLWIGLQRSYDLSNAWNTFGPGSKNFSQD
jgi:hypothetical protein